MHPGTDDPGTDDLMIDDLAPLREALGDLLTARRNAAGLTQRQLAHRVNYARSTVGGAEGGHRVPAESFWKQCDQLLGGGGELLRAYHQLAAARSDNKQRRDLVEQARRDARRDRYPLPSPVRALGRTVGAGVAVAAASESAERVFVVAAAHESSDHASRAEASNVGETTLEQLDADVLRIANGYVHAPPLPLFVEMLRVRDRVYRLLEGRQKPSDTAHLYLIAGALCGLLANASTDLGHRDAAAEQARAGWIYAEQVGHNGLSAWTRGMQALIEYWSGRPRPALQLVQSGHRHADSATARVRLLNIEARIHATTGNVGEVNRCMQGIAAARGSSTTDTIHDEIGGVFAFDEAKSHYYAGATYVHLGSPAPALEETSRAIELYANEPASRRSFGPESLARIDAGTAHLLAGNIDGAREVLQPVLTLPVDLRITQVSERLTDFRRVIAPQRAIRDARALDEHVESFIDASTVPALPGSP